MAVLRSKSQKGESLIEHYKKGLEIENIKRVAETMLDWIERLEKKLPEATIYGLTSHWELVLMPTEKFEGLRPVVLSGFHGWYKIKYLMQQKDAPWINAYVYGEFTDFDEAIAATAKAIWASEMWPPESLRVSLK